MTDEELDELGFYVSEWKRYRDDMPCREVPECRLKAGIEGVREILLYLGFNREQQREYLDFDRAIKNLKIFLGEEEK